MDDQDVERRMREGLAALAEDADATAPVAARAMDEVRRRRMLRWGGIGAAAAAVVVIAVGVSVLGSGGSDREQGEPSPPVASDPTDDGSSGPRGGWRTEYWGSVAIDVPAEWGYGGAPFAGFDGQRTVCSELHAADGERADGELAGYVGRPVVMTDACAIYPWIEHTPPPETPFVWLGAAVEPGVVEYENGFVQETVVRHEVTVTVGAVDAVFRERVLDSLHTGGGCQFSVAWDDRWSGQQHEAEAVAALRVCAYRARANTEVVLSYQAEVGAEVYRAYLAALGGAEEAPKDPCPNINYREWAWVVLERIDDDGVVLSRDVVHPTACGGPTLVVGGSAAGGPAIEDAVWLTEAMAAPWAVAGVPAIVPATTPSSGEADWIYRYFIGPQG